ncbi:MAG: membrane protein insertase YidC [Spirochaetes bacterium]|nr:MAG: membrane protein insertase YidC [Spirochaetota bacterium]
MEKRAVVAIALSLAVWLIWSYFFLKPTPQKQESPSQETRIEEKAKVPEKKPEIPAAAAALSVQGTQGRLESFTISTAKYKAVLSSKGAAVSSFVLKDRNIELVVGENQFNARGVFDFPLHLSEAEFLGKGGLDDIIWNAEKISEFQYRFSANLTAGRSPLRVEKTYTFSDKNDYFKLSFRILNQGQEEINLPGRSIIVSPSDFLGPHMDFNNSYNLLSGIYFMNNSFEKLEKGGLFSQGGDVKTKEGATQWIGVMSRYFLLIMLPEDFSGTSVITDNRKVSGYRTGLAIPVEAIKPGKDLTKSFKIYIGPKDKEVLRAVDEKLIDAADVSKWIEPIRDFLLWSLTKINMLFGNFGWSLVVFSLITKIILLPLTMRSTESMKKLQALNPQITEIRAKFKDKPDQMNKKIMALYKQNKVNPLSGCLPLLLQMPFFFALYSALINSIDLWQAPFVLWIKDLSLPDTIFTVMDFNVNVLPIIMTGTTYLQQKMSTGEATGQQQKMLMFMPLFFIVIFWNMPSGLVLYWIMQNVLQILHQLYINRKSNGTALQKA